MSLGHAVVVLSRLGVDRGIESCGKLDFALPIIIIFCNFLSWPRLQDRTLIHLMQLTTRSIISLILLLNHFWSALFKNSRLFLVLVVSHNWRHLVGEASESRLLF